jgi:hypothetical protein
MLMLFTPPPFAISSMLSIRHFRSAALFAAPPILFAVT